MLLQHGGDGDQSMKLEELGNKNHKNDNEYKKGVLHRMEVNSTTMKYNCSTNI